MEHNGFASRFLRGAKDLIWQEEPLQRKHSNAAVTAPTPTKPVTVACLPQSAVSDKPLQTELMQLVMQRNSAFSALSDASNTLREIVLDEATRFRSAFALLKKNQSCSKEQMMQALQSHLEVLAAEVQRFNTQSKQAQHHEIDGRQQEVVQLQSEAAQQQQQIAQLRSEMDVRIAELAAIAEQKLAQAHSVKTAIEQKKSEIAATQQEFARAATWVEQQLLQQKQKIEQYLA